MDEFSEILLGVTNASKDVRTASEEQIYSMLSADPAGLCTSLVTCLRQSPVVTVREMAAVLFRRYVFDVMDENFGFWTQVPEETQGQVKQEFLDALVHEEERSVRNKVCDAICLLAKCLSGDIYEATLKFDDNGRARVVRDSELEAGPKGAGHFWPELLYALWQCAQSEHADFRLSALRIFSTMPQLFGDELDRYLEQIKLLLEHSFADDSSDVRVVATKAFAAFMIVLEKPQHPPFFELLPTTLALINDYAEDNPEDACECLTSLTELAEYQPKFFRPNLAVALESMLGLACNTDLNTNVRQTALEVLSTIAEEATHMVKKFDQYKQQCIPTFLNLMAELEEDEEWSKIDKLEDPEETGVAAWAEQALDRLACALGGKAVLPLCFELIPPMLQREEWQYRHAALMALSAIGEGVHKALLLHLTEVVQTILPHLADPHERVRFACCNTVGQMATDFSPKHNNLGGVGFQTLFHAQVVPALLQVTTDAEHPRVQAHAAAALVNFCEHSSKEVLSHHLDDILEHLSGLLESSYIIVQEQAISTLSTVADAAEDLFRSYYSSVMPHLISILAGAKEKEHRMLRGKTMECVSLIGLAVGKEMFLEDAREVMSQFEDAQATSDDPDDPQINYLLTSWARICQILGEDFVPYLKVVLPALLQSLNKEAQVVKLHTEATEADLPDQENWSLADFDDQVFVYVICLFVCFFLSHYFTYSFTHTHNTHMSEGVDHLRPLTSEEYERCVNQKNRVCAKAPFVKFMMDHLKKIGCEVNIEKHFVCEPCGVNAAFDAQHNEVVLCARNIYSEKHMAQVITHELVHVYDHCRGKLDLTNVKHMACTEIRAASLSTECYFWEEILNRFQFGLKKHHQACVKRRALRSIMSVPNMKVSEKQAKQAIEEVWDVCFNDTAPFDRIPP
eukprot:m.240375 g.240375  ORF g.240375 m.240375 type:complete len:910 (+) comp26585_c1_seq6:16-2745(+)